MDWTTKGLFRTPGIPDIVEEMVQQSFARRTVKIDIDGAVVRGNKWRGAEASR